MNKLTQALLSKHLYINVLIFLFFLGYPILKPIEIAAQTTFDLSVTPPTAFVRVRPGTSAIHVITLENTGAQTITIKPRAVDFIPNNGSVILQDSLTFPYLELPASGLEALSLQPEQKSQLSIKINPPPEAVEGEHYLTILFESVAANQELAATYVKPAVASNLVILIAQKDQELPLQIKSYGLPKIVDSFRPLAITPQVYNSSIQAAVASGSATLSNWNNKEIYKAQIFPDIILGKELRSLRSTTSVTDQETGLEQIQPATFTYSPKFIFGPYKIEYSLQNSSGENQVHSSIILALPLTAILVGLLVGLTQLIWQLIKSKNHSMF